MDSPVVPATSVHHRPLLFAGLLPDSGGIELGTVSGSPVTTTLRAPRTKPIYDS